MLSKYWSRLNVLFCVLLCCAHHSTCVLLVSDQGMELNFCASFSSLVILAFGFLAQEQGLRLSGSFKCLNSKVDLSTLEAEATLDLWEHQMQRLRNESSVRTITRELHMAQSVPTVRIRAFKNGEGSRGQGEILIGSSIPAVCLVVLS